MRRSLFFSLAIAVACSGQKPPAAPVARPLPAPPRTQPVASASAQAPVPEPEAKEWGIQGPSYAEVVQKVETMTRDASVGERARKRGLDVVNVAWEDTGRAWGSALGPNISDVTLQVRYSAEEGRGERTALMPVLRFPNFSDKTGDISRNRFFIPTGNQSAKGKLSTLPLSDVLRNLRGHLSKPGSVRGTGSFLAARDTHFLVSAQAVFLPIPKQGKAEFNPVVFNYQSEKGSPAVLTLLVTRQGTSITVIENSGEDSGIARQSWGQELYFNEKGKRAAFNAERQAEVKARIEAQGGPKNDDERSAIARGADVMFLIQIPLVHKQRGVLGGLASGGMWGSGIGYGYGGLGLSGVGEGGGGVGTIGKGAGIARGGTSDVDRAVVGHGLTRGPFLEGRGYRLERDARFPIRITVQFYKATSNGVVTDADLDGIAKSLGDVYEHADFVGSLVTPAGTKNRPTEWQSVPGEWFPW
jgi:hypothetical protein